MHLNSGLSAVMKLINSMLASAQSVALTPGLELTTSVMNKLNTNPVKKLTFTKEIQRILSGLILV
jgi:hypothetical protein